ncbi:MULTISPECIES: hypothetical protein [unclassified Streptococcus]|uniref:hypothetical protein n=1 Tax=unclassified Streptococcus TaxID=2608887 RepID=UPI0011B4ADB4|nr:MULTISPECIES: hypothetical protein [unclassified Streptococcus]TWS94799.1 hypothetical protein FRX52_02455 [Streptococcus sp. sy018]TWT16312.1 hypothetical protein FRX51_03235 [Streptococcus sp. sy010]
MKLSRKTVKELCTSLTKSTLEFVGFELMEESGYLLAQKDNETPLLIYLLSKQFSEQESPSYKADKKAVDKFEEFVKSYPHHVIPCIAYAFTKGNIARFETVIVPIEDIRELEHSGGVFSNASGHLYYNSNLASDLPKSAIHKIWKLV